MRQAGPPRRFASSDLTLVRLLRDLDRHRAVTYVHVQHGGVLPVAPARSPPPGAQPPAVLVVASDATSATPAFPGTSACHGWSAAITADAALIWP